MAQNQFHTEPILGVLARAGLRSRPRALLGGGAALAGARGARLGGLLRGELALRRPAREAVLDLVGETAQVGDHRARALLDLATGVAAGAGCLADHTGGALAQTAGAQQVEQLVVLSLGHASSFDSPLFTAARHRAGSCTGSL